MTIGILSGSSEIMNYVDQRGGLFGGGGGSGGGSMDSSNGQDGGAGGGGGGGFFGSGGSGGDYIDNSTNIEVREVSNLGGPFDPSTLAEPSPIDEGSY